MKYKLIKHEPSFFRDISDVHDLNILSNIDKFLGHIKDKGDTTSNIENHEETKTGNFMS